MGFHSARSVADRDYNVTHYLLLLPLLCTPRGCRAAVVLARCISCCARVRKAPPVLSPPRPGRFRPRGLPGGRGVRGRRLGPHPPAPHPNGAPAAAVGLHIKGATRKYRRAIGGGESGGTHRAPGMARCVAPLLLLLAYGTQEAKAWLPRYAAPTAPASASVNAGVYLCEEANGPFCEPGPFAITKEAPMVDKALDVRKKGDATVFYSPMAAAANFSMPVVALICPLYDKTLEEWLENMQRYVQHLASYGFAVLSSTDVARMGLFPGPEALYAKEVFWNLGDHTVEAVEALRARSDLPFIDASRVGVAGYSVGGSLTIRMTMEAAARNTPVLAAVALGPTIGSTRAEGGTGGREIFTQGEGASRVTAPLLLLAGTDDDRGGVDGVDTVYERFVNAPRVKALVDGATHCFVAVYGAGCGRGPRGSCRECEEVSLNGDSVMPVGNGCQNRCTDNDLRTMAAARQMSAAHFLLALHPDAGTLPEALQRYREVAPAYIWGSAFERSSPVSLSSVQKDSLDEMPIAAP